MRQIVRFSSVAVALTLFALTACRQVPLPSTTEVVMAAVPSLPSDPGDAAWQSAPEFLAKLQPQDIVEPRLMKPSTAELRVRAMQNGKEMAVRLEWIDATKNDVPGPAGFYDACAIQVLSKVEPSLPAPQMGEPGRPVEITYWNAGWQATVEGRGDSIKDIYPNASIDHYPFEAPSLQKGSQAQREMAARYAPARALGNAMSGPRQTPVQDLIAEGPGTLTPAKVTTSEGKGRRTETGWSVMIKRRMPQGISPQVRSEIAFAVWEGSQQEVGARKMRTVWIPLSMQVAQ